MAAAVRQSARAEYMLPEESGCLEPEVGERTADITQHDIVKSVDIQSAQKVMPADKSIIALTLGGLKKVKDLLRPVS